MVNQGILVREVIRSIEVNTYVWKACLSRCEEDLVVANTEIKTAHSVGVTCDHIGNCFRSVTKVTSVPVTLKMSPYAWNVLKRRVWTKNILSQCGEARVYLLSNNRYNKSNPLLDLIMFHKIYHTWLYINSLEKVGSTKKFTPNQYQYAPTTYSSLGNLMTVTSDIHYFQLK